MYGERTATFKPRKETSEANRLHWYLDPKHVSFQNYKQFLLLNPPTPWYFVIAARADEDKRTLQEGNTKSGFRHHEAEYAEKTC